MGTYGIFLGSSHLLDSERIIKQRVTREVFDHILLHELNTEIRVIHALDLVSNTRNYTSHVSAIKGILTWDEEQTH